MKSAPLRKAAILIASLDDRSAVALLDQMGPKQAARVRGAILQLGKVDPDEQQQVIEEFMRRRPLVPNSQQPGIELDGSLANMLANPVPTEHQPEPPAETDAPPFRFLHEAAADTLTGFLRREHPQTIAVVISHLPPDRAAEVIANLPAQLQAEVLRRVAELDDADAESIREVERELESLFCEQLRTIERRSAGLGAVNAILRAAAADDRRELLANLAGYDSDLAGRLNGDVTPPAVPRKFEIPARRESVQPSPQKLEPEHPLPEPSADFDEHDDDIDVASPADPPQFAIGFSDFVNLDDASLAVVLCAADPQVVLLAMSGANHQLLDRMLKRLSSRDARQLRRKMEGMGPLRLSDVDHAQLELVELACELAAEGKIQLPAVRHFAAAA